MKSRRVLSGLEPLLVCGLIVAIALVGFQCLSTVISHNVRPLASLALVPEEPTAVAMATDDSRPTTNR